MSSFGSRAFSVTRHLEFLQWADIGGGPIGLLTIEILFKRCTDFIVYLYLIFIRNVPTAIPLATTADPAVPLPTSLDLR